MYIYKTNINTFYCVCVCVRTRVRGLVCRWMGGYVDRWVDTCSVRVTFMTTFFSSCYQFNILLCLYLILFIYSPVPTPSSPTWCILFNPPPPPPIPHLQLGTEEPI